MLVRRECHTLIVEQSPVKRYDVEIGVVMVIEFCEDERVGGGGQ